MQANVLVKISNLTRDQWLEWRKKGIGGSDAAAVCGLSRWKSPIAIWMEKAGHVEPLEAGESAYWGTQMEPLIRKEFIHRTGLKVKQVRSMLQHKRFPFMTANLDGIVTVPNKGRGIYEAKTAGVYAAPEWETFIPDEYAIQIQHYMAVTGLSFAYVAVLIGGNKFMWRYIKRDNQVIDLIIQLESRFWQLVETKTPPDVDGSSSSTDFLKRLYAQSNPQSMIILHSDAETLITEYEAAQRAEEEASQRMDAAANRLKQLLGENEIGVAGDRLITWKSITSEKLDTKAIKTEMPEVYKQFTKQSTYRKFAIK